jgi:hypothetical protein
MNPDLGIRWSLKVIWSSTISRVYYCSLMRNKPDGMAAHSMLDVLKNPHRKALAN